MTRPGFRSRTACAHRSPTSPCPMTTTVSSSSIGVWRIHCTALIDSGRNVAVSSSRPGGSTKTVGTAPKGEPVPYWACGAPTIARSPALTPGTDAPTSTTSPAAE